MNSEVGSSTSIGPGEEKPTAKKNVKGNWLASKTASKYYRVAFLDFLDTTTRLVFTIITKLVFTTRDVLSNVFMIFQSGFFIILDFVLILTHSGLTFVQRYIVQRKQEKWRVASQDGSTSANLLQERLDAFQNSQIVDLANTRNQFWAGEAISIRDLFLLNSRSSFENKEDTAINQEYSSTASGDRVRVPTIKSIEQSLVEQGMYKH